MARYSQYLARVVHAVERGYDSVKNALAPRLRRDALLVYPYLSYGTRSTVRVRGRVLEDKGVRSPRVEDGVWTNLRNAWRRFESDEVPGARVRIEVAGATTIATTDREGFFDTEVELPEPLPQGHPDRIEAVLTLLEPRPAKQSRVRFPGEVLVPRSDAEFGVISDVDDTVLVSDATRALRMARKVIFGNARTRLPFPGVAGLYRELHRGRNPVFYVSSSPWNLYDVLADFLEINAIPSGPLLLRDWGIMPDELLPTRHGDHKHEAIEGVLRTYPDLPFVLIGDSGQEDPEIYREVVERWPGQVLGIVIRDVSGTAERRRQVRALAEETAQAGVPLTLARDSAEAARAAAAAGWLTPDQAAAVADDVDAEVRAGG